SRVRPFRRPGAVASRLYERRQRSGQGSDRRVRRGAVLSRQRRRSLRGLARERARLSARESPGHGERRHALRAGGDQDHHAVRLGRGTLRHAAAALSRLLEFSQPADETLSRYFRAHPELGQQERGFVADAAGSATPEALVAAAAIKVLGLSARSLEGLVEPQLAEQIRAFSFAGMPAAVRADLPDWLWDMLVADYGEAQAERIAAAMLNPAPLDLRVNLARTSREEARARLAADGVDAQPTPYSPAGLRVTGKPAINRHALFRDGLIEVQDEGSQVLAWLLGARRGEMVGDYCAGAGGKTLAVAMLMRGTG